MTDYSDLFSKRDAAGARYKAAVTEFRAAFVDLAAIDHALMGKTSTDIRSFGPPPDLISMKHPDYAPNISGHLGTEIAERRNHHLKGK